MPDIFETPRDQRWQNLQDGLTRAQRDYAAFLWTCGRGTDSIADRLGVDESKVWNCMNKIRRIEGKP